MIKTKNKLFAFLLGLSIILVFSIYIYMHTIFEKDSIKEVLETFIKDDYNYSGGKNDFSTVGNENFKKYLIARNTAKSTNYKRNYTKVLSQNFEFDYKVFVRSGDCVKVNVYMLENCSYEDEDTGEIYDAGAGNDYVVYLSKINGKWKVMSATIKVDADAVDDEFDVNKELGYEGKETHESVDKNLNKMLNRLNYLKEVYSKPLK
ncbi:hypothetical protein PN398_12465 [Romboutsia sp. 1001216sp1]|uniref:hypothetical protein n=1 Tax=Romboutsia TaxID=1501226 RepID=UPI000B86709A|nr:MULTISPECIES: hypothetical protein [Romboutsia]MDB8791539.1 hypothetical protein [Romboutsia sp. 1001216sp1]MDB8801085.1 hypothetical protein [Romboutsia sp. 1001216sp1]MDB8812484.1 hypothetical protein [Romboutsia sp. 1001216sp1]